VEAGVNVIFLLWNNSGYAEIKRFMVEGDIPQIGVDIYTPDFQGIAAAFGCEVAKADNLSDLSRELKAAQARLGPTLIEVRQEDFVDGPPFENVP
jgi:acetolactate synthase-1/2/3 large subunit